MLRVTGVHAFYGRIEALSGVDVEVREGEVVSLIGANGAGKSTLLMTICGDPRAAGGRIEFDGADITHLPTHEIVRRGIAQAPEGRRIFPFMSILENLQMGAAATEPRHFEEDLERVFELYPVLRERKHQRGGTLSGGEQQMLVIARAMMSRPRILLLDEPSLGLAPRIVDQIFEMIRELRASGLTILLVEQNAAKALEIADRAYVVRLGEIAASGTAEEVATSFDLKSLYLGG